MRQKEERLIIAFRSTHDAIGFEEAAVKAGAKGRLIPLPKEISAGCGLSWSAPPDEKEALAAVLEQSGIEAQEMRVCLV